MISRTDPRFKRVLLIISFLLPVLAFLLDGVHWSLGLLVAVGSVVLAAFALDAKQAFSFEAAGVPRPVLWVLLAIVFFGSVARFTALEKLPTNADPDEGRQGAHASLLMAPDDVREGRTRIFSLGWYSLPNLSYVFQSPFSALFGFNLINQRRGAALWGVLTLLVTFFLARAIGGDLVGLVTTFLLACSTVHVEWSRIGASNSQVGVFYVLTALAALRLPKVGPNALWWSGLFSGLALHSYQAGKVLPFIVLPWLCLFVLLSRRPLREVWDSGWRYFLGIWLVYGPLFLWCLGDPKESFLSTHDRTLHEEMVHDLLRGKTREVFTLFLRQMYESIGGVAWRDGTYPFAAPTPLLDPISAGLGFAGALAFPWRRRLAEGLFVGLWIWMVLFLGGVLMINPIHHPRFVGMMPVLCWVAAYGLVAMAERLPRTLLPTAAFAGILALVAYVNLRHYFVLFPRMHKENAALTAAQWISELPKGSRVVIVRPGHGLSCEESTVRFATLARGAHCLDALHFGSHYVTDAKTKTTLVLSSQLSALLGSIETRMPASTLQKAHFCFDGGSHTLHGALVKPSE